MCIDSFLSSLVVDVLQMHEVDVALVAGILVVEVQRLLTRVTGLPDVIVQTCVKTFGSSTVSFQSIVFASIIRKRSVSFASAL